MSEHCAEGERERDVSGLLNTAGAVVWEFDWSTGAFTYVSDGAEEFLGFTCEEWLEPGFWLERVHPDDVDAAAKFCQASTVAGNDHDFEYRMVRRDGSVIHVRDIVTVDPVKRMDGALHGLLIDITDRERAKSDLERAQERYKSLIESTHLIAAEVDVAGTVTYCNDAACRMMGMEREDVVGHSFLGFVHEDARDQIATFHAERMAGKRVLDSVEIPFVTRTDGVHTVRFHTSVIRDGSGAPAGAIVMGEDITPQLELEDALRRKAQDFEAVFTLMRDLYFRLDDKDRYTYFLAPAIDDLLVPPSAFLGKHFSESLPPHVAEVTGKGILEAHRTGEETIVEYELSSEDGQTQYWEARLLPLPERETAVVARNVTKRVRRELALHESEERYRSLVQLSPYAIQVFAVDRPTILFANPAAATLLDADSAEDLIGRDMRDSAVDPACSAVVDAERVWREVREARPEDDLPSSPPMRLTMRTLSGRVTEIERSVAGFRYNGAPAILVISRDISREIESERAVRESKERFQHVVESSPLGMNFYRLDQDHRVVLVDSNPAADEILGFRVRERYGLEIEEAFPGLAGTDVPAMYRRIALVGGSQRFENVFDQDDVFRAFDVTVFQTGPGQIATMFTDVTERYQAESKENAYRDRLRAMASELTTAEDRERRHLAEELHDRVSQSLAVARMHLDSAASTMEPDDQIDRARALLEDAIAETRAVTTELAPPVLYELGLGPAVRWICEKMDSAYGLHTVLDVALDETGLDDDRKMVLFRVARELLMNVVKHAGTLKAEVSLYDLDDLVVLTVEDAGLGFDVEHAEVTGSGGFGLFSIRERLSQLGGTFSIVSGVDEGTTASVSIPHARGER